VNIPKDKLYVTFVTALSLWFTLVTGKSAWIYNLIQLEQTFKDKLVEDNCACTRWLELTETWLGFDSCIFPGSCFFCQVHPHMQATQCNRPQCLLPGRLELKPHYYASKVHCSNRCQLVSRKKLDLFYGMILVELQHTSEFLYWFNTNGFGFQIRVKRRR
jgi:hypothetical protein